MRPFGAVVAAALITWTLPAFADPTPGELAAARDLFARAEKDEDAGKWDDALDKLRRASSVKMTAGRRFHIALCEEKLGQLVAALADYTAADQAARQDNNKDVLDAVAEPLRVLRLRVPTLTLEVPPADGTTVSIDGKPIAPGVLGVAMPVEPGTHRIEARAHGKRPYTIQVTLKERDVQTTTIKWVDLPKMPEEGGSGLNESPPPPAEAPSGGVKVGAIVATVSAAAVVGFGIGAFFLADGAQQNLVQQCPTSIDCGGMKTEVRAWDAVALGSWIAGAGLATLAIVLWAKPSHPSAPSSSARLVLRPGGLAFAGSF